MMRAMVVGLIVWAVAACADDGPSLIDDAPSESRAVELIGVSGRRLDDGDVYRVPLDYEGGVVAAGDARREAFVVRNMTAETATVIALAVRSEDGVPDEWSLLAPVRARDVPLDARGSRLPAGARLDFDVGLVPRQGGERAATLELVVALADRTEVRVVELRARCSGLPP